MNIKNLLAMLALTVAFGCTQKVDKNPFLSEYNTPYQVPPFNEIKNEHYIPAYEAGIQEHKLEIEQIITNTEEPTFANTIEALEFAGKTLQKVRAVLSNLRSSATNDELQEIARVTSPMVSNHYDEIYMNPELFARVKSVYENKDSFGLNTEQLKLVENTYKQFVRGGANLNDEDKEKMKQINSELSLLSISFRENVNKDNDSFQLIIDNESDLEGLPQSVRCSCSACKTKQQRWQMAIYIR